MRSKRLSPQVARDVIDILVEKDTHAKATLARFDADPKVTVRRRRDGRMSIRAVWREKVPAGTLSHAIHWIVDLRHATP